MEKTNKRKEIIVILILMGIYLIINGIFLVGHEHWRDEANVWLVARDNTPFEVIKEIRWQGHPCLWYFIVMPFAKLGFPFETISVLSYLFMTTVACIFMLKAPFHMITKTICLFSPIFTYYYPVVARNYCVLVLLLLLLAHFYPKRNEKSILYGVLLGLLVQADTLGLVVSGFISLMWLWECVYTSVKKKIKAPLFTGAKGLWIPLASFFFWVYQFSGVSESPLYLNRKFSPGELLREMSIFAKYILNRMTGMEDGFNFIVVILFLTTGVLAAVVMKNAWPTIVVLGLFVFQVIFSLMIYQLHIWHYIMLCFTIIWSFWLGCDKRNAAEYPEEKKIPYAKAGKAVSVMAQLVLVVLGVTMFLMWISPEEPSNIANAYNGLYSDGKNTAAYIKENVDAEELIITTDVSEAASVVAYLNRDYRFYFAGNGEAETFSSYRNEQNAPIAYAQLLEWIENNFPEKEYFYLMECSTNCLTEISKNDKDAWELCYQTPEKTARSEEYSLYKIALTK